MANFMARDSKIAAIGQVGMSGGSSHVDEIWSLCSDEKVQIKLDYLLKNLLKILTLESTNAIH